MYLQLKSRSSASAIRSDENLPPYPSLPSGGGRKRSRSKDSSSGDEEDMRPAPKHPSNIPQPSSPPPPQQRQQQAQTSSAALPTYDHTNRASRSHSARATSADTQEVKILDRITYMLQQSLDLQQNIESERAKEMRNERLFAHRYFAQMAERIDDTLYDEYRLAAHDLLEKYM